MVKPIYLLCSWLKPNKVQMYPCSFSLSVSNVKLKKFLIWHFKVKMVLKVMFQRKFCQNLNNLKTFQTKWKYVISLCKGFVTASPTWFHIFNPIKLSLLSIVSRLQHFIHWFGLLGLIMANDLKWKIYTSKRKQTIIYTILFEGSTMLIDVRL